MSPNPYPVKSDLKQLTLRAAVVLAARCARRVQPILAAQSELLEASQKGIALAEEFARGFYRHAQVAKDIYLQTEFFPRPLVREPFPRDPRLDLPHAMGAARETAKAVVWESGDLNIIPPSSSTKDLISHAANAIEQAALVTAITLEGISIDEAFRRNYERTYPRQAQETVWAADAIRMDYEALKRLQPGTGVEIGSAIDPSDGGEVGPLWPTGVPRWFEDLNHAIRPSRLAVVVPVDARRTPQEFWQTLVDSTAPIDVLCLSVGDESGAFTSTSKVLDWVKGYCSAAASGSVPNPNLIVLASASCGNSAIEEQKARSALVYQFGAVVFSRGIGIGEFPDWIRVQSVLPTLPALRAVASVPVQTATQIGLPPATARAYGRQPAHVDDYDPAKFEKAVERINKAEWWELDY